MTHLTSKKKLTIARILIVTGTLVAGISLLCPADYQNTLITVGIIVEVIAFSYSFIFVRCSFCHHMLPLTGWGIHHCPHCGEKIE